MTKPTKPLSPNQTMRSNYITTQNSEDRLKKKTFLSCAIAVLNPKDKALQKQFQDCLWLSHGVATENPELLAVDFFRNSVGLCYPNTFDPQMLEADTIRIATSVILSSHE